MRDGKVTLTQTAQTEADSKPTAEVTRPGYALKPNKADEQRANVWV